MQEGLFMKFSDHYGKLLSTAARPATLSSGVYDEKSDTALLQQTIQAYKDAIVRLQENQVQTKKMMGQHASDADVLIKDKAIITAIMGLIKLGESGCSYPVFLTEMMKRGLDKAIEGAALNRDAQVYLLEAAKAIAAAPGYIQQEEDKLALFDTLSKASAAGFPNTMQYTLGCEKIEWTHQPVISNWNKIKEGWEKAVFWLDEWITAYCSFAPSIAPWAQARNPMEAVIESQECVPGKLRVWEQINRKYFTLSLKELFRHSSFEWDVKNHHMYWSQGYIEFLLNEIEPLCLPRRQPLASLIEKAAAFHTGKRKVNPAVGEPARRYARYFNSYFGEGEYEKRFGWPEAVETNAAPWEWKNFSLSGY
ncbi:MAG: hypothetical protein IPM85_14430 [Chitinophagaceae bacterium]|nr:hypothetical protein [Chitinophagaceae bacterium]